MSSPAPNAEMEKLLVFKDQLTKIVNAIHASPNIQDLMVNVKNQILALFNAERITLYAIDVKNQQLYSAYKSGAEVKEIRVPKSFNSIAGFVALSRQPVVVRDAYNAKELEAIHPRLKFDAGWDSQTGFRTQGVLATPVVYDKYLMGVLQVMNKKDPGGFTKNDLIAANEMAKTLGIAFYNQRRMTRSTQPNRYGYLIDKGILTEESLEKAVSLARMNNEEIEKVLEEKTGVPKEEILKSLGAFFASEYFLYDGTQRIPADLKDRLNYEFLKKLEIAPLSKEGGVLTVAMEDPTNLGKFDSIKVMGLAARYKVLVGLKPDIIAYLADSYGVKEAEEKKSDILDILGELTLPPGEGDDGSGVEEETEEEESVDEKDSAIVRLANEIIKEAYLRGASDIHVEPNGANAPTLIRFRVDGECHIFQEIPPPFRNALVSRLKIMSKLDISEKRKPQDGKIRFKGPKGIIELRVATIPTTGVNEDVVMRILAGSKPLPLEAMQFSDRNLSEYKKAVQKPYGFILCVGPTGSGKTTTLHSALGFINKPDRKIWTAEDPVEITQAGLRQVQINVKAGLTFAAAMRSFLRADPDVIMVGEMRDHETAATGIEASLTGHLVFSTLHTNSAPETIVRLLDMDIDPFNFADSILAILAQRLGRTLCAACKEEYHPDKAEYEDLVESYGREHFPRLGIAYTPDLKLFRPKGCTLCGGTGYKGRIALHELLTGTDEIKSMVQRKAPAEEIREQAIADGMTTLMQDGIWKVFIGKTDMKQVRSVCIR
jgi:type II secretory ATPase GspE/PulE/Tfp pilus assembly ATPase PilB-like protein